MRSLFLGLTLFLIIVKRQEVHSIHLFSYFRWEIRYFLFSVYQRFAALYSSLDVCQLSLLQRRDLCHYILSDVEYRIEVTSSTDGFNYSCKKNIISLTSRDVDYLETNKFSTWQCPEKYPEESKYRYYVGKNHLRDAALLYKFSKDETNHFLDAVLYPDATVINISRLMLAYAGKPTA